MAFHGWKVEALEFFEGLEADNSKAYWQRHKDVYETIVRAPMEELLAELEPEFGEGRIFRPYRDVRFSRDTSPYKTAIGATLGLAGALAVRPLMESLLSGVRPRDTLTLAMVPLILAAVAFLGCAVPGRRAARIQPIEALRR